MKLEDSYFDIVERATNEYQKLLSQAANAEYANRIKAQEEAQAPAKPAEVKVVKPVLTEAPFKVGQTVIITNGTFADTECNVVSINFLGFCFEKKMNKSCKIFIISLVIFRCIHSIRGC